MSDDLSQSVKETIQSAARRLTGFCRRAFQAEMTVKYCSGNPRRAERTFGWWRDAVHTGLNERRTGIRCLDNFAARGRHKTEERDPQLVARIHSLAAADSQADPKFQTPLAFTRVTAKAVRRHLVATAAGDRARHVPAERTVRDILNRLGYRMRRVRKTLPQKKFRRPTPSSSICGTSMHEPPATRKRCVSRSTPRPR